MGYDHQDMRVQVTIGVQQPEQVDAKLVKAELPSGKAEVSVVHGGIDIHDKENDTTYVVATATIAAMLTIDLQEWRLSGMSKGTLTRSSYS